jgi:hypothetical protein
MLFGKSLFQSVVDRLGEEKDDETQPPEPAFRIEGLNTGFVAPTTAPSAEDTPTSHDQRLNAYMSVMQEHEPEDEQQPEPERLAPAAPPPPPPWLQRLSPEEISADLGLHPADDRDTLQERRRSFARENHPDLVATDHREAATTRMKIANRLIDDAIRRFDQARGSTKVSRRGDAAAG